MTLSEVIKQEFGQEIEHGKLEFGYDDLIKIHDKLQNCDEFFECHLIISDRVTYEKMVNGVATFMCANTHCLFEGNIYSGAQYLYQISLSPIMYDPNTICSPVLYGCTLTPTVYSPENFKPYRKVILQYDMVEGISHGELRRTLHQKLDDLLDEPKKYEPTGMRSIMLRGLFKFKTPDNAKRVNYIK
jgi:hypothetical protein